MDDKEKQQPGLERPLECCGCKKPVDVCYIESIGQHITRLGMCKECPVLLAKLYGESIKGVQEAPAALCCGSCGVTLDDVKMGAQLGCPLCYEIFSEEIMHELVLLERVPPKIGTLKRSGPLHCGRTPGQAQELDPSLKVLALQQVLHETLGREDYEQAARLRDQIRAIEEAQQKGQQKDDKEK